MLLHGGHLAQQSPKGKIAMPQFNQLSGREREVIIQLLQGKSNKSIASSLDISVSTVEFHLSNIYAKFQVGSRIELILKLWKTAGGVEIDELGYSPVDSLEDRVENGDRSSISQLRGLRSIMRTYRLILAACVTLILLTLALPLYTASRIPGSIIMWRSIILLILPAAAITFLLLLWPRASFRILIIVAGIIGLAFFVATATLQVGSLWFVLYLVGAGGVLIASRYRSRGQDSNTSNAV